MTDLYILVEDKHSNINLKNLLKDFEKHYGGKKKLLGLSVDIERERAYLSELESELVQWESLRKNFSSHFNCNFEDDWLVDIDSISIFLESVQKLINTMARTIAVPDGYPKEFSSATYSIKSAVNLEEESYRDFKKHFVWSVD